jgi:hypothetical protein
VAPGTRAPTALSLEAPTVPRVVAASRLFHLVAALVLSGAIAGQETDAAKPPAKAATMPAKDAFTLENLFPKKGLFGPAVDGPAYSFDSRYAVWLHRPYRERRHGNDLWLLDCTSGIVQRLTSVSVMAAFQKATRKVAEDRVAKAKKAKDKDKDNDKDDDRS